MRVEEEMKEENEVRLFVSGEFPGLTCHCRDDRRIPRPTSIRNFDLLSFLLLSPGIIL